MQQVATAKRRSRCYSKTLDSQGDFVLNCVPSLALWPTSYSSPLFQLRSRKFHQLFAVGWAHAHHFGQVKFSLLKH